MDDGNRCWRCPKFGCDYKFSSPDALNKHIEETGHACWRSNAELQQEVDALKVAMGTMNDTLTRTQETSTTLVLHRQRLTEALELALKALRGVESSDHDSLLIHWVTQRIKAVNAVLARPLNEGAGK